MERSRRVEEESKRFKCGEIEEAESFTIIIVIEYSK